MMSRYEAYKCFIKFNRAGGGRKCLSDFQDNSVNYHMAKKSSFSKIPTKTTKAVIAKVNADNPRSIFPIVGIGASAGGLKALELFLRHVPKGSGMAFVIVQHLDPTHPGMMPEILQRVTAMSVSEVENLMKVQPDCVYIIPPNKDMMISNGLLQLSVPTTPRGLRLPIDFFLESLAHDQGEKSIGVILSGMGSDGTLGLRAIKEMSGVTLAQDPETAEFDSMPRNAINAGLVDIVAAAEKLPELINGHLKSIPLPPESEMTSKEMNHSEMESILTLLHAHTGNDFTHYKKNTLHRRVERRMDLHQISTMASYVRYLQENSQELSLLFNELLIGVTSFFRDPEAWDVLRQQAIPQLFENRVVGGAIRAWVPGCSTGEEAYSLAMVMQEAMDEAKFEQKFIIQIFATDLDRDAIEKARLGYFEASIKADVSEERLKRFFVLEDSGYRVRREIREMVIFASQNLIMDPPFTKMDILCCRNLLIYLTAEVQKKLILLFHYSLKPSGILFQGSAETIGEHANIFTSLSAKFRIFQRAESMAKNKQITFPVVVNPSPSKEVPVLPLVQKTTNFQTLADQLVLQHYAPPAVITGEKGDILYISGQTGKYLEPAAGKANWNLFVMARDGLRYELASAFQKAIQQREKIKLLSLKLESNGGTQYVDLSIQQLHEPGPLEGLMMVVFTDLPTPVAASVKKQPLKQNVKNRQLVELERELLQVRGETRATHEEMQTSQEELRSANEELQSTNEELQSTNEEITTSKEEMQSLNEELQTVNAELQAKVDELSRTSNDMKNLLDSTDIATLFLDKNLNVRRFTPQATKIIKLIPSDAGRPITDLVSDLSDPTLADDVCEVLRTLRSKEKSVSASDGRWFMVRIMPYRTFDDRIDGVVITFTDVSVAKTLEAKLRGNQLILEKHVALQSTELKRQKKPKNP